MKGLNKNLENFLDTWEKDTIKYYQKLRTEIRSYRHAKELYPDLSKQVILTALSWSDLYGIPLIKKERLSKQKDLLNRVNKKCGNIISADNLSIGENLSINGTINAEKGKFEIETIYAEGYVQQPHFRVLIKQRK